MTLEIRIADDHHDRFQMDPAFGDEAFLCAPAMNGLACCLRVVPSGRPRKFMLLSMQ